MNKDIRRAAEEASNRGCGSGSVPPDGPEQREGREELEKELLSEKEAELADLGNPQLVHTADKREKLLLDGTPAVRPAACREEVTGGLRT